MFRDGKAAGLGAGRVRHEPGARAQPASGDQRSPRGAWEAGGRDPGGSPGGLASPFQTLLTLSVTGRTTPPPCRQRSHTGGQQGGRTRQAPASPPAHRPATGGRRVVPERRLRQAPGGRGHGGGGGGPPRRAAAGRRPSVKGNGASSWHSPGPTRARRRRCQNGRSRPSPPGTPETRPG